MEKRYNLAQLSSILRQIITSQGPSLSKVTIKNYVSDLRHFLSWFQSSKIDAGSNGNQLETLLSSSTLETYVSRLQVTSTPRTTINRRLSSIRLLSQFCAANNLAKNNQIANVKRKNVCVYTLYEQMNNCNPIQLIFSSDVISLAR